MKNNKNQGVTTWPLLGLLLAAGLTPARAETSSPATTAVTASADAVTLDAVTVIETAAPTDEISAASLKDVFAEDTAVNVGGPTASSQKVYVNGIDELNLNVQIDGARQSNNIWHHNGNTLIDPGLLKAARIAAGVAPADTGPGALGGAIQYETKDVADLLVDGRNGGAFVGAGYESNAETFSQSGAGYGRSGGFEALGYVSHGNGTNFDDGSGNEVKGTAVNLLSTLGKLAYESSNGNRIELGGQYLKDDDIRPYRANFADVRGTGIYAPNEFTRKSATLKLSNTQPTPLYDPELLIYFNESEISRPSPTGEFARGYFDSKVLGIGGTAKNTFVTPIGSLVAGVDFYGDDSKTDNYRDPLYKESATNVGAFTQLRSQPLAALALSTGLRVDHQRYDSVDDQRYSNTGLSPNVDLRYTLAPGLSLNGAYSYVFGGIPLAESALFHSFPYVYSDDLDPQRARNYKIGAEYALAGLTLGAEWFDTLIDNVAAYNEDDSPFVRVNGPDLETRGYRLSARYRWEQASIGLQYTDTDVTFADSDIGTTAFTYGSPVGQIFKATADYRWSAIGLLAGLTSEIALKYDYAESSGNTDLDSYEVFDVFAQWTPPQFAQLSLRGEVNNLLDKSYVDRFTSGASLGFISPLREPGRSFVVSTRLTF